MEKQIKQVIDTLTDHGFQAYLVGGYVRDALLGISSKDIDICTDALPKDIHAIFHSTNSNYGSVNLKNDKYNIDITTFRKDLDYVGRHPSKVEYVLSLEEDLKRRDFKINTICMDKDEQVIDLLSGVEDLNNRLISSVGDPYFKLREDPLRILRAIRFATVLDFNLDEALKAAIKDNKELVGTLSKTRVRKELDKILLSKNFLKGLTLLKEFELDKVIGISFDNVNYVDDLQGMWSQIDCPSIPFTNNEKSNIIKITKVVKSGHITYETLYNYGLYVCTIAGKILNISPTYISKMYQDMPIKTRNDIKITSKELEDLVGKGKVIGETLDELTSLILQEKLLNDRKEIITFIKGK